MKKSDIRLTLAGALAALCLGTGANAQTLRLLTWADYAPKEIVDAFTKETGIAVEVTLSNNEEMISKLRATQGAGFDLAQPSQDRILGPQQGLYLPGLALSVGITLFLVVSGLAYFRRTERTFADVI